MNSRGRTYVQRKSSAKDRLSSYIQRAIMDDRPSTQSFPNLHHRPSFHLAIPSLQSTELGYPSPQPSLDPLEQYGGRGGESTASYQSSSASSGGRRANNGGDRGLLNTSGSSLDGDAHFGGHIDGESGLGSHFVDPWYGGSKKEEVWEDRESCESAAGSFYGKGNCYSGANDVFFNMNCVSEQGVRRKLRPNCNNYGHVGYDVKSDTVYNKEANVGHLTKQTTSYNRSVAGSFSDNSVDYSRTDSRVSDSYSGREEDYGSSCGSGEDQLQPAEVEGPWVSVSPSSQAPGGRWRGPADGIALASGCLPHRSPSNSGTCTQKLDSFSDAFLFQRKRRFPTVPIGDSPGQVWDFGVGRGESPGLVRSRQSCAFDSDSSSCLPPSSSSSPAHPSSSHLMSSVLSPPPTPLPPPPHSPSKMDSPGALVVTGHSVSQGGESPGALQIFASHFQSLPSIPSSGMIWKFPVLAHNFTQTAGSAGNVEANLRSSHCSNYGNATASHNVHQSPDSSFLTSLHPPTHNAPSLHSSFHLPSHPPQPPAQPYEAAGKIAPYAVTQKVKNGPANLSQSQPQQQASPIHTGTPFPSILQSSRGHQRGRYTPRPLLNPARRGRGLYSSLSSLHHRQEEAACEEDDVGGLLPCVNVGPDFQAELPPWSVGGEQPPREEPPREQLLWKPWDELERSTTSQEQVEKLLIMCGSSCLPGGGSNTELALHCLHLCQGDTMATLEMLLFSQPLPTGDYHYSGSDFWTDGEKGLFSAALGTYGKEFSLIQKLVRTKTVCQCVEYFYLSKKLQDKQKKQKEEEDRNGEMEQQKSLTPTCQPVSRQYGLEEVVPVPSLASFFPCKLCGKMFYKIKSRNAHMKIHRQPQEDWTDRRLQHQLLTQRLALSRPINLPTPGSNLLSPQAPARTFSSSGLPGVPSNAENVLNTVTSSNAIAPSNPSVLDPSTVVTYSDIAAPNSHVITNMAAGDSNQREPTTVLPFHQSWGSFGHGPDPATFFCNPEGKDDGGAGTVAAKEPINWQ